MLWSERRFFCDEYLCPRQTFTEETVQVPYRARSTRRLRDALVSAVIASGRAAAEAAAAFGVSWWLVQRALDCAGLDLPDVDAMAPRMLGIDELRYQSVRFFRDPTTKAWKRFEPWMTTIVDFDTGQVLGIVDGRDSQGVGDWLFTRPLEWRLGVQVVAIDPSAAFGKALRMWLPPTAVSVDTFHLVKLSNDMLTEVRQRLTQQVHGRRGRSADPVWANRRLLLRAWETLSDRARDRLGSESRRQQHCDQTHQKDRPGIHQRRQLQNAYPVAQCRQNSGMHPHHGRTFTMNREEPVMLIKSASDSWP